MYCEFFKKINDDRKFLSLVVLTLVCGATLAQTGPFPNRMVKIIVPYSAGSGSDAVARAIGQGVSERSNQTVLIENREGGGSLVGTLAASKSPADGYTLLIVANPFVIGPTQKAAASYDPIKDFVPVAKVAVIPLVLASATTLPAKNMTELVAYAKANPGKLSYASSGPGTISQQEMEVFKQAAGLDIVEVGYKSTGQALTDVVGGTIPLFPVVVSSVMPHLKSGRLRVLGVFDTRRTPLLPDVFSIAEELRIPGYTPTPVWYGFVAPAGTPREAVDALKRLIESAMQTSEVRERMLGLGALVINPSNEQFAADLKAESEKASVLAKRHSFVK